MTEAKFEETMTDSKLSNDQVRKWLGGGYWLGRVQRIAQNGFGYIAIYDDSTETILKDKFGNDVDNVWASASDLSGVAVDDWVVFEPEDSPIEEKRKRNNDYQMQAVRGSVKLVKKLPDISKEIPNLNSKLLRDLKHDYSECIFFLRKRVYVAIELANELEEKITQDIQIKFDRWKTEQESRFNADKIALDSRINNFEAEKEHEQTLLREERRILEDAKKAYSNIEEKIQELRETEKLINSFQDDVNQYLSKWGFQTISELPTSSEPAYSSFNSEIELMDHIIDFIQAKGFEYSRDQIVNFYTCLKTGSITILAGLSGTGKSSLIRLFSEAIGANFESVPVKATWSDDTDLLGFYHPEKKIYISTRFLETIIKANAMPDDLFFVCLDEMNLSRVEWYFSDFLSVLEQGEKRVLPLYSEDEWKIRMAYLKKMRYELEKRRAVPAEYEAYKAEYEELEKNVHCYMHKVVIPNNLFICGTVNVDETTYPFPDKVLDRSQIIQYGSVEFNQPIQSDKRTLPVKLTYSKFREYSRNELANLPLSDEWFNNLNRILKKGGFHFGHRVKQQIEGYCRYGIRSGLFEHNKPDDIIDLQLVQKILPKIRGINTYELRESLFSPLFEFFESRYPKTEEFLKIMQDMESINYWQVFRHVG